jgi:hypothetical protein
VPLKCIYSIVKTPIFTERVARPLDIGYLKAYHFVFTSANILFFYYNLIFTQENLALAFGIL